MKGKNDPWDLKSFLEAVTAELDRSQDLLRVKSVNRPLTYSVKDFKLELQVFAEYDGDSVRFRTAAPGEEGASTLEFNLGSITDRMVAETTKDLPREDDLPIDDTKSLKPEQRKALKRMGVDSKRDVDRLAKRRVKLGGVDFADLASQMDLAQRPRRRPRIRKLVGFSSAEGPMIRIYGEHMDEIRPETVRLNATPVATSVQPDVADLSVPEPFPTGDVVFETLDGETMRVRLA